MDINIQSYSDPASPHPPPLQLIRIAEKCTRVAPGVTSWCPRRVFRFAPARMQSLSASLCRSALRVLSFGVLNKARTDETDVPHRCRA